MEGRDVIHPFSIHEERLKLLCTICEKGVGVCSPPRCVTIAMRVGWEPPSQLWEGWAEAFAKGRLDSVTAPCTGDNREGPPPTSDGICRSLARPLQTTILRRSHDRIRLLLHPTTAQACIQCRAPRCLTAFHASCARRMGWHMVEKEKNDWVLHEALCEKHRPKDTTQRKKKRRRETKW